MLHPPGCDEGLVPRQHVQHALHALPEVREHDDPARAALLRRTALHMVGWMGQGLRSWWFVMGEQRQVGWGRGCGAGWAVGGLEQRQVADGQCQEEKVAGLLFGDHLV